MLVKYVVACADGHVAHQTDPEEKSFGVTVTDKEDEARESLRRRDDYTGIEAGMVLEGGRRTCESMFMEGATGVIEPRNTARSRKTVMAVTMS